jgi:transposase
LAGDDSRQQKEPSAMNTIMIGLDLAKNVFQGHGIDAAGAVTVRRKLRRGQVEPFFAGLSPCVVGLEACGGAHHWARLLQRLGHEVRMMPAHYVKPYVKRNKTDARDAEAICDAMRQPTMRFVAVKSEEAQGVLALIRTRALLVRQRTMTANAVRAGLAEYGVVAAAGNKGLQDLMRELAASPNTVPTAAHAALSLLAAQWESVDGAVRELDRQIARVARAHDVARRLLEVPGIGPIAATTIVAKVADAGQFRTARDFAAWVGLTPRQCGTGGKQRSVGISKQGDRMLRQLFIMGASARLYHARARGNDPWLAALLARRPAKVAIVALAAKTARTVCAMLKTGAPYRPQDHRANLAAAA